MATEWEEREANRDDREHPRHLVHEKAVLAVVGTERKSECDVLDLSLGGCRLLLRDRLPVSKGVAVEGTFRIRGTPMRLCGTVRWTDGKSTIGVLFVEMSARCQQILGEVLEEISVVKKDMLTAALLKGSERATR